MHEHSHESDSIERQWCLDFANTVGEHTSDNPVEHLTSFEALIDWGVRADILTPDEADIMRQENSHDPAQGAEALRQAIALREAIYRLFLAVTDGYAPNPDDLDILNAALAEAQGRRAFVYQAGGFGWAWRPDVDAYAALIGSVALSMADLLLSDQLARVKRCANDSCGWLFIDTSRNGSRRWCDMSDCGNRAKARRHYRRIQASKSDQ